MKTVKVFTYAVLLSGLICTACNNKMNRSSLTAYPGGVSFMSVGQSCTIHITSNTPWKIYSKPDWCNISGLSEPVPHGSTSFTVTVSSVPKDETGSIILVSLDGKPLGNIRINAAIIVKEGVNHQITDKKCHTYLSHTTGNGVDIVFMGDGFTAEELADGTYENALQVAAKGFFSIQPYKSHCGYFNIYFLGAVSTDKGISTPDITKNTKFKAKYDSYTTSSLSADIDYCKAYVLEHAPLRNLNNTLIVLVTNSSRYAGTCWYSTAGWAVAICPMSTEQYPRDFSSILQHEAGGHGFAKLADEYYSSFAEITQEGIEDIRKMHTNDCYANIDLTNDLSKIRWKEFIGHARYSMVGAFEGARYFANGVWRPEQTGCMVNNITYHNAPSRAAIVKRILTLAGENYSFQKFVETDIADPVSKDILHVGTEMSRLAPPKIVHE